MTECSPHPAFASASESIADRPSWLPSDAALEEVDSIEADIIAKLPPIDFTVTHRFTPGMYIREILMPKGSLLTSKIHKTEHPFVISKGECSVWTSETGVVKYASPLTGITKPGTKRVIFVHEDTIWTTFHVTDKTSVAEIEADIIFPHENPLLNESEKKRVIDATK